MAFFLHYKNCSECDRDVEIEEPQTCYYTGTGSNCGDCPGGQSCFYPIVCYRCKDEAETDGNTVFEL